MTCLHYSVAWSDVGTMTDHDHGADWDNILQRLNCHHN